METELSLEQLREAGWDIVKGCEALGDFLVPDEDDE